MKKFFGFILDILYPKRCPICHRILDIPEKMVCRDCFSGLVFVGEHFCMKCGKPVRAEQVYCEQCDGRERGFTQGRSILLYNNVMKASMIKYKYEGRREYGDFYAKLLCHFGRKEIFRWNPDIILPVPLHKHKLRARGFNQAEYLAMHIGRVFGIPVGYDVLKKIKNTRSQKKLNAVERKGNLKDAFSVCEDVSGLNVLIIDDVYTTGSTMDEIASLLCAKNAKKVYFLTICTGYN